MAKLHKTRRNELCSCGSGRKFKRCCEAKQKRGRFGSRVLLVVVVSAIVGAVVLFIDAFTREAPAAGPRQVWSPEHGHYHNAP